MTRRGGIALGVAVVVGAAYLGNASWLAGGRSDPPVLLAHRGVHQTFSCPGLNHETCTAACIEPPTHVFLENTLASMRAAFDLGATVVELDLQPTTDGRLAVFHDWRLECRTDGAGVTRERSMADLAKLDIGYGYTADGGRTFPFRGRGLGLMPTLDEVLDAFPNKRLLIHMKSKDATEGARVAAALLARPVEQRRLLMVYGAPAPTERVLGLVPEVRGFTRQSIERCLLRYEAWGWTGWVPGACRGTVIALPRSYARWLWGWPRRFVARMKSAGTEVFVASGRGEPSSGIDTVEALRDLGAGYDGGVWTDKIEVIGPAVSAGRASGGE